MATETLIVELDARTSKIDAKLEKTESKVEALTKEVESADKAFVDLIDNSKKTEDLDKAIDKTETKVDKLTTQTKKADDVFEELIDNSRKIKKLDKALEKTENKVEDLGDETKKTEISVGKFASGANIAGAAILKTALAATALAAAVSAMVIASAKGRRELEVLATQAKTTTADFQALAFATSRYGIDAEKIADASKDIADRLGEFAAAGTGVFQDYADAMKLSKDEARAAAEEFKGLSSQEILGTMVSRMEDANVAGDTMLFVMESLANDASKLIPLFANNSKELIELKKRFSDVNDSLQITGTQAAALRDVSDTFTLMTSSMGNASTAISATLAPVFDDFFNDIIDIVPDATQTIIDFVNSFLDAENITSIAGVNKEIEDGQKRIELLTERQANSIGRMRQSHTKNLKLELKRKEELEAQLVVLQAQEKSLENARRLKGGQIGGEDGDPIENDGLGTGDEKRAIEDRFKGEEQLLAEKLVREIELVGANSETKLQLEQEFADNIQIIRDEAREKEKEAKEKADSDDLKGMKKAAKAEEKIEALKRSFAGRTAQTLLSATLSTRDKVFSIVKDSAAGQIEAYGLTAGAKALAELGPIAGPPVAASYIGWSQVAAGVVRALPLGGGGSGGAGTPGGGGSNGQTQQQRKEPDFQPETSSLEFTDTTESGQATINLTVPDGDLIGEAIASWLSKAQNEGRV
tara:strand:- start:10 stop:2106 length:2097 start_codon:yes stop_codon:yes gene_type:complete